MTWWLEFGGLDDDDPPCAAVRLKAGDWVLGRDPSSDVVITDRRASARHAVLSLREEALELRDLDSSLGTTVNGRRVTRTALRSGDAIGIGRLVLTVRSGVPAPPRPDGPRDARAVHSTGGGHEALPTLDWRPFRALVERLRASSNPKDLLVGLLRGTVEFLAAERGVALLADSRTKPLAPVAVCKLHDEELAAISRTVCEKVRELRKGLFVKDSLRDELCQGAESLALPGKPRTILCSPLADADAAFGVLYVDRPATARSWTAGHLHLFESVTGFASELLGAVQTRKRLLQARRQISEMARVSAGKERLVHGAGGDSARLEQELSAAARHDVTVLITGETGTGKEMVARTLHGLSDRREGPFVAVNCAALPRDLIEAELFGAEAGAFTGASTRRLGRFELAAGGSLFLDEVGELPKELQVKLLRVLEERAITRLGGQEPIPLDFRLIAATNADLERNVGEGTFRTDLYFRLNVFRVELKPLRERTEDILPLARHFLDIFAGQFNHGIEGLSPTAEAALLAHQWPGNIRELRNAIERAVVVETRSLVHPESLPILRPGLLARPGADDGREGFIGSLPLEYEPARDTFDQLFLERSLRRNGGIGRAVARETGLARSTLQRKFDRLGLRSNDDE